MQNNTTLSLCYIDQSLGLDEVDTNALIKEIASTLNEIVIENRQGRKKPEFDSFFSKKLPDLNLLKYLERFFKYSKIEPSTMVFSIIYIDRVCNEANYILSVNNIHRLLLTSLLISIKYNEDDFFSNSHYATVGGFNLKEVNQMEHDFLALLKFNLFVSKFELQQYLNFLL